MLRARRQRPATSDPVVYPQWVAWLEEFARGEADDCTGLAPLVMDELGEVAAVRITERCAVALNARLDRWSSAFSRDLDAAHEPLGIARALTGGRARLAPIHQFAESPLLFEELRSALREGLDDTLRRSQEDLERSVYRVGGDERLLRLVREQPITRRLRLDLETDERRAPAPGRRMILGGPSA